MAKKEKWEEFFTRKLGPLDEFAFKDEGRDSLWALTEGGEDCFDRIICVRGPLKGQRREIDRLKDTKVLRLIK